MCSIASVCKQEVIHCGMAYRIKEGIIVQYNEWIENIGDIDRTSIRRLMVFSLLNSKGDEIIASTVQ